MSGKLAPRAFGILVVLVLAGCQQANEPAKVAAVDAAEQLTQLYADYDEEYLALNPLFATFRGDNRFNDQWFPHDPLSDEYAAAALELDTRYLAQIREIDVADLGVQDRLNYDIFMMDRENAIEREEQGYNEFESLTPVSQFFSMPSFLVMLGSGATAQPFATPQDYDNWIARSSGFVPHVDLSISRMREGVELGVVRPRILMEKALPQLAAQVVDEAEQSDFWGPITNMPDSFSDEERSRIESAYRYHIDNVLSPAYAKLHDYIKDEYMQHARESIGQNEVPGGPEYYAFKVR